MKKALFPFFFYIAAGCTNKAEKISPEFNAQLFNWRRDSSGCQYYRNYKNTKDLIDSLKTYKFSQHQLLQILGEPNSTRNKSLSSNYKYNFGGICNNNKIIDSVDYCWLEITIPLIGEVEYSILCY